jgi:oxygen-independent coproporphyrinogen-3 oxidase
MRKGLYIHIPFCDTKCIYCDFYSLEKSERKDEFVRAMVEEIRITAEQIRQADSTILATTEFATVFFGGGTPSLLSPQQIEIILQEVHRHFRIAPSAEQTMECNPGTVTEESLRGYRSLGINRLSFGVQTFFESELQFLSRIHSPKDAIHAIEFSRRAGFDNLNVDLMFSLPGQTLERWKQNLDTAISLETEHISAYSLTYERGTQLNAMKLKGRVKPLPEELDANMYETTMEYLDTHYYEHYEVSAYCRDGKKCEHNLLYWSGDQYLAFGPGAHGYWQGERYWNIRSLHKYIESLNNKQLPILNREKLTQEERMNERAYLELRAGGIRLPEFKSDFGVNLQEFIALYCSSFMERQYWTITNDRLHLTRTGFMLCDTIAEELVTALEKYL